MCPSPHNKETEIVVFIKQVWASSVSNLKNG